MKAPSASRAHRCSQLMKNIIYFREKSTVAVTATGSSLNKRFNEQNNGVHVRYSSLLICLPSSTKQPVNVKCPNSALSGEREPQLLFLYFYFTFFAASQIQFQDSFDSDKHSK